MSTYNEEQSQNDYLNTFEEKLQNELLKLITKAGELDGQLLSVEELEEKWKTSAPEYMVAAVPQIADYPTAAIAWAGYVGMGAAVLWDRDWNTYRYTEDFYSLLAKPRGFDEMDEYVTEEMLRYKLDSADADKIGTTMLSAAQAANTAIRKESIEPQSAMAFYVFARTTKVFYKLGIAMALKRLGYKYEKVTLG